MKLTEEMREVIESCLYTFAGLTVMHTISERQRDVDECLKMIDLGLQVYENNPCYQCEYRKPEVREYINVCLLDESQECIRDNK